MIVLRGKSHYQRGYNAQHSGFKLATSTFVVSILIATSHKHCAFTITYCSWRCARFLKFVNDFEKKSLLLYCVSHWHAENNQLLIATKLFNHGFIYQYNDILLLLLLQLLSTATSTTTTAAVVVVVAATATTLLLLIIIIIIIIIMIMIMIIIIIIIIIITTTTTTRKALWAQTSAKHIVKNPLKTSWIQTAI